MYSQSSVLFRIKCFFERETEHVQREGESIPSAMSAEPDAGLEPTIREIMTRAKIKSWTLN